MTPTKTRPHKPMLAEWTSEILSLSLSRLDGMVVLSSALYDSGCGHTQSPALLRLLVR